ncbi:MAG: hypothetical protein M5U34_30620 [Chloroflexi bacterium]|nr:hypothetical protein [Chloroflexota bacterium]
MRTGFHHLVNLIDQEGAEPAVLVIDQFEELFTICEDEQKRRPLSSPCSTSSRCPIPATPSSSPCVQTWKANWYKFGAANGV